MNAQSFGRGALSAAALICAVGTAHAQAEPPAAPTASASATSAADAATEETPAQAPTAEAQKEGTAEASEASEASEAEKRGEQPAPASEEETTPAETKTAQSIDVQEQSSEQTAAEAPREKIPHGESDPGLSLLAAESKEADIEEIGNGLYTEIGADLGWNDRLGAVVRTQRVIGEVGYFVGEYPGTYRFGTYWRVGAGMSWEPLYIRATRETADAPRDSVFLEHLYYPHLALTRGAEILNVGVSWKLRAGPFWTVDKKNIFFDRDARWGGALVGEIAGAYNFTSWFSTAPRLGVGIFIDEYRAAFQFTVGIGFNFNLPFRALGDKEHRYDDWESEY